MCTICAGEMSESKLEEGSIFMEPGVYWGSLVWIIHSAALRVIKKECRCPITEFNNRCTSPGLRDWRRIPQWWDTYSEAWRMKRSSSDLNRWHWRNKILIYMQNPWTKFLLHIWYRRKLWLIRQIISERKRQKYTLLCIKYITSENLLYSTGNSTQCCAVT